MSVGLQDSARRFQEILKRCESFVLTGHVNIDGDSLGSMLAMYYFLRQRGKRVRAFSFEPLLDRYSFLAADELVEVFDRKQHGPVVRGADCFMMFDFSSPQRIPGMWEEIQGSKSIKVCIDHHQTDELPGDLNFHDASAAATGKIVMELIRALGGRIDRKIAEALLVAISTDTGWFRYSNTSPSVLADAAELLHEGLDACDIYREIYQRNDVSLIRLMGRVAAAVHEELAGRLIWGTIPIGLVEELGVGTFETDELLDLMRTARDAEVVALFREMGDGEIRLNLRSRGLIDVSRVARDVGGGGHVHAAGANLSGPLDVAASQVVAKLRDALAPVLAGRS